jgi:hypothetical protein
MFLVSQECRLLYRRTFHLVFVHERPSAADARCALGHRKPPARLGSGGHSPVMIPVSHRSTDRKELGVSATVLRENSRGKV